MPERLLQFMPFLATVEGGRPKINTARLLEIIITLAAVWYGMNTAIARLEVKVDAMKEQVTLLEARMYEHMTVVKK